MLSLLKPVTATMAIVVFLVHALAESTEHLQGGFSQMMVYREDEHDSAGTIARGVLLNAASVVATLFVVTTLLFLLYKFRCYVAIYGWLFLSVGSLLFLFGGFVLRQLLALHSIPIDSVSFTLLMYNFSAVGTLLIFWTEVGCGRRVPRALQQSYLVLVSALLAWSATKLPEWSTWAVLLAVSAWDVVAVLAPRGPLKMLVEEAEVRDEPIPGLVYEGDDIKLGLGDFVFYSVLVGRASMDSAATAVACAVSVLFGLCATLALLPLLQRVLPALPISIALGIGVYFSSSLVLGPLLRTSASVALLL